MPLYRLSLFIFISYKLSLSEINYDTLEHSLHGCSSTNTCSFSLNMAGSVSFSMSDSILKE